MSIITDSPSFVKRVKKSGSSINWPPPNYSRLSRSDQMNAMESTLIELGFDIAELLANIDGDWINAAFDSFNAASIVQVLGLAQILAENQPLTVRSAMYRGIGKLWEDSSDSNYRKCSGLILKMRRLGLIPYSWIVDGTRVSDKPSSWSGLADFAQTVADAYRKNLWERQEDYIEVFVEKDAMSGVIRPITREYDVKLNPIRGFGSETFLWGIAEEWKQIKKPIYVYYLGDHDPAGLSIEHDLRRRLEKFCEFEVSWERLAITHDDFNSNLLGFDVTKKKYPPAKLRQYLDQHGTRGVEVDAIPAPEIRARVEDSIVAHIDGREWKLLQEQEEREKTNILDLCRKIGDGEAA
jgi:hypothetical protein